MKIIALLVTTALCAATAVAQEPNPADLGRIRAQQERLQKIFQAADNLQAAGMEREANQLREQARRQMEELEAKVRQAREAADGEQPDRKPGDRDQPQRDRPDQQGDRDQPRIPQGGGAVLPPPDRPRTDVAQLQAQIAELRGTVRMLAERLERLEAATKQAGRNGPRPRIVPSDKEPQPGDGPRPDAKPE